jgi:hypothetical protein
LAGKYTVISTAFISLRTSWNVLYVIIDALVGTGLFIDAATY